MTESERVSPGSPLAGIVTRAADRLRAPCVPADAEAVLLSLGALDKSDTEGALRWILRADAETLGVERVSFWALRREPPAIVCEQLYLRRGDCFDAGTVIEERCYPRYFEALGTERVIAVDEAQSDPVTSELYESYFGPLGITSMLDVPVWVDGALAGVICHEHVGRPRHWTEPEREFAIGIAQSVATVLETRRRESAEDSDRRSRFLSSATALLAESLDVDEIPVRLAKLAVPFLGDWCAIEELDGSGLLRNVAAAHVDPAKEEALRAQCRVVAASPESAKGLYRMLGDRQPIVLPTLATSAAEAQFRSDVLARLRHGGTTTWMSVPLVARGTMLGAICCGASGRSYGPVDRELALELAHRAAIALDNARLFHQAIEAIGLRDEFLSIASHELRTPLTALQLAVQALRRGNGSAASVAQATHLVERQARRLGRLVTDLLDVSRFQSGQLVLQPEEGDLVVIACEVLAQLAPRFEDAHVPVCIDAPPSLVGSWDRSRLEQVLANLLENAVKFGRGKPIEVTIARRDERAVIAVRDHGIGIERERLPKIFERFERAVSPRHYGGLGLGLYIVRGIVEAHGGTVRAESEPGEGATFTVELPLAPPAAA